MSAEPALAVFSSSEDFIGIPPRLGNCSENDVPLC